MRRNDARNQNIGINAEDAGMSRSQFLGTAGVGAAGLVGAAMFGSNVAYAQPAPIEIKLQMGLAPWLRNASTYLLEFVYQANQALAGQVKFTPLQGAAAATYYSPSGHPVPVSPTTIADDNSFPETSAGTNLQACWYTSQNFLTTHPLILMYYSPAFGMGVQDFVNWMYNFGGLNMFTKHMAKPQYNVVPIPVGAFRDDMSGWYEEAFPEYHELYRRLSPPTYVDPITGQSGGNQSWEIRMWGLGGMALRRALPQASAAGQPGLWVYDNVNLGTTITLMSRPAFKGFEFSMAATDRDIFWRASPGANPLIQSELPSGTKKIFRYLYPRGWHQPSSILTLFINKQTWELLSPAQQNTIKTIAKDVLYDNMDNAELEDLPAFRWIQGGVVEDPYWPEDTIGPAGPYNYSYYRPWNLSAPAGYPQYPVPVTPIISEMPKSMLAALENAAKDIVAEWAAADRDLKELLVSFNLYKDTLAVKDRWKLR